VQQGSTLSFGILTRASGVKSWVRATDTNRRSRQADRPRRAAASMGCAQAFELGLRRMPAIEGQPSRRALRKRQQIVRLQAVGLGLEVLAAQVGRNDDVDTDSGRPFYEEGVSGVLDVLDRLFLAKLPAGPVGDAADRPDALMGVGRVELVDAADLEECRHVRLSEQSRESRSTQRPLLTKRGASQL